MVSYNLNNPKDYIISYDGMIFTDVVGFVASGGSVNNSKLLESGKLLSSKDNRNEPITMTITLLAANTMQMRILKEYHAEERAGILLFKYIRDDEESSFEHSEAVIRDEPDTGMNLYMGVASLQLNLIFNCSKKVKVL